MSLVGKSIGNYVIKSKLGEGGMGAVYLGEHPLIGKRVAVKVLLEELASREEIVQRFFNEAKAVNDIGHQNIVDIVDFGKTKDDSGKDVVYFIMEFLDGDSLHDRLARGIPSFEQSQHIVQQCCSALAASHAKGIVHRDLKPDNIYLITRGASRDSSFVKILDFGIAKLTGDGPVGSHKTRTGMVIGTPSYMSPEQCEGRGHIDARSDVYSMGVVMYEMLTGRVPFVGEGFGEIIVAHLTREPERPTELNPSCPPELEAIVLHAMEKDRNRRFQSMQEFEAAMRDPLAHLQSYSPLPGYQGVLGRSGQSPRQPSLDGSTRILSDATPRPTTLSGAAAQLGNRGGAAASSTSMIVVGALIGLMALGGGGYWLWQPKSTDTQPIAAAKIEAPPAPESVLIKVTSEPPGANVTRADQPGVTVTTPCTFSVAKSRGELEIEVQLIGFETIKKSVSADMNKEIPLTLTKVVALPSPVTIKAPPVAAVPAVATKRSSSKPSSAPPAKKKLGDIDLIAPDFH